MDDVQTDSNPRWLVKSGERILGPYATDEVIRKIMTKEIVVIDEVISPGSRWSYVRDVPVFSAAVEEARRGLMSAREDTEVQGYTDVITQTDSSESFRTVTAANSDSRVSYDVNQIQDAEFVDKPNELKAPLSTIKPVKHFGLEGERSSSTRQRRSIMSMPGMWVGTAVVLIAVIFAIYTSNRPRGDSSSTQASASRAWNRGEFDRALDLYRRIERSQPGRPEIAVRLAQLMIRVQGETAEAKRLLQAAADRASEPDTQQGIALTLGLIALKMDDTKEAERQFTRAGDSWIVAFNRGVGYMMTQSWARAVAEFRDAGREPIAQLMLARSLIAATESPRSEARKNAVIALERLVGKDFDFRQEALVLRTYLAATMGDKKEGARLARRAIETDPELTEDHFHDPALILDPVSWSQLLPICLRAGDEIQSTIGRALISLCLAKANRLDEANKILQEQLSRYPADGLLNAVSAYVHLTAGREDAARAALRAAGSDQNRLAATLVARLCMRERNETCAEDAWARLASETPPSLAALTSLARIRFAKGERDSAGALLVKAESMSPRYLPLLRLREETSR